jgi:hypothetical protein
MSFKQPFVPKPNSGNMFINNNKRTDNHPDFTGELALDRNFVTEMMNKSSDNLVKIAISAWEKTSANGKTFYSFKLSAPYVKPEGQAYRPKPVADDSDVPF